MMECVFVWQKNIDKFHELNQDLFLLQKQVLQTLSYSHVGIWGEEMENVNGLQML